MFQKLMAGALILAVTSFVAFAQPDSEIQPEFVDPEADRGLPNVLLIGDSISVGYTLKTRELLAGEANVYRIPENGGPTSKGIEHIDAWLRDIDWDVIHFNWGLHDIRRDTGEWQVDEDAYRENLTTLVRRMLETGANLIWATTTPVPEGASRRVAGEELRVNGIAEPIMAHHGVAVNDLHAWVLPRLEEFQRPANVHFNDAGSAYLAEAVADAIRKALGERRESR